MEPWMNAMLANPQIPQIPQAGKKNEAPGQKDGFQKLLEQKQGADASQAPKQEKPETSQKPQESQDAQAPQETEESQEVPAAVETGKELEDRMALAAMAMLQTTVVPVEQVMTPEVQAEAVAEEAAPLAMEAVLAPEVRNAAPETEKKALAIPVEEGGTQTVEQPLEEELPQTIQAPEPAQKTEERTVEVKVESGEAVSENGETAETGETAEPQGGEMEAPVFEDVKAVPVKVGEAPKAAETEQPVEKQVAPRITEALAKGETRVELQLTPENLGKVTVEMTWGKDGSLVVQVHAENRGTQDLLAKSTQELAQLLGRETQQEVRVEVPRQEESQRQDLYEQQQEQHQRRQQEQRQKQEAGGEDFLQQLRLGLIPLDGE